MDSEELAVRIAEANPDIVGINAMTPTIPEALQVAAISKKHAPQATTVLEGGHLTLAPAEVIADAIESGNSTDDIPGLYFRSNGALIIKEKVKLGRKHVNVFGFFMIGFPGEEDESDVQQTFELTKSLDLDRWTWSIYSPLSRSTLYEELIAEGKIETYRLDHHQVHFTEAYEGVCDFAPDRLKAPYREINEYFYKKEGCRRK